MHLTGRVEAAIRRHRMFEPGGRVGVAVSGGADSICLLHLLAGLAPAWGLRLTVLHLNHRLRGRESDTDEQFVAGAARRLGLPFVISQADFSGVAGNLEQEARRARIAFFRRLMGQGLIDRVAAGHTRSDQAETVLFRLLRGAGTAGLAGIRPVTAWGLVRPLIDIERADVDAWLRRRNLRWREDSTNASPRFARNRIRRDLLPQLEREWNPAIADTLASMASWAQAEEAYWEGQLDRLGPEIFVKEEGALLLSAAALAALPEAVLRRLLRRAIQHIRGGLDAIDFRHVQRIAELAVAQAGTGRVQLPGLTVERSFDWLRLAAREPPPEPWSCTLSPPAAVRGITLELVEKPETSESSPYVYNRETGCLDWGRLAGSLQLRTWRPGDRYRPAGSAGEEKLKTLFQKARIPVWDRRSWPVLVCGDVIVWVRRFGIASDFAANSDSSVVLLVRERE